MPVLEVVLILIVVGVLLWLMNTQIEMDAKINKIINAFVVICVVIWLITLFLPVGFLTTLQTPRLGK
jgi:hypothetical protein